MKILFCYRHEPTAKMLRNAALFKRAGYNVILHKLDSQNRAGSRATVWFYDEIGEIEREQFAALLSHPQERLVNKSDRDEGNPVPESRSTQD